MDKTENELNQINSWKVRDGRQKCNFDSETEDLIKKHIEYFNKKESK